MMKMNKGGREGRGRWKQKGDFLQRGPGDLRGIRKLPDDQQLSCPCTQQYLYQRELTRRDMAC